MRTVQGLSLQDAATALGCTAVSCRVRFHRAKKRLAERLAYADVGDRPTRRTPCTHSQGATP
ncbi:MAG: sigma factor-like helix-turn-helix DNA-binding protein [Gemmatimonadaceae bacterium]